MAPTSFSQRLWVIALLPVAMAFAEPRQPDPAALAARETRLKEDVETLAATIGPRSLARPGSLEGAAGFIEQRWREQGYEVKRHRYAVGSAFCDNVEIELPGADSPRDEIVLFGAHYDTVPVTPGADDNASGVAALLALSEALRGKTPGRTLRFVAFANEEPVYFQTQFMGSRVYAARCKERGERIVAMISLESIGYYTSEKKSQRYPFPMSLFYPSTGDFVAFVGNIGSREL